MCLLLGWFLKLPRRHWVWETSVRSLSIGDGMDSFGNDTFMTPDDHTCEKTHKTLLRDLHQCGSVKVLQVTTTWPNFQQHGCARLEMSPPLLLQRIVLLSGSSHLCLLLLSNHACWRAKHLLWVLTKLRMRSARHISKTQSALSQILQILLNPVYSLL